MIDILDQIREVPGSRPQRYWDVGHEVFSPPLTIAGVASVGCVSRPIAAPPVQSTSPQTITIAGKSGDTLRASRADTIVL